jgi:Mrp family chromosome partitioning ATPase
MIVLRTAVTDRKLAQAKLEMLDQLPVRIVGTVLNDIRGESHYRYYSYASGYGVPDEEMEDDVPPRLGARVGELAGRT